MKFLMVFGSPTDHWSLKTGSIDPEVTRVLLPCECIRSHIDLQRDAADSIQQQASNK